ncbi:MAG: alkaline phosphatase family protein [Nitrososphaerota archaeon]
MRKLFLLGLDSAPPKILYDEYGVELNALREIIQEGERYLLKSCHPPITIPAWMVMFTGKSPGELGIYGFRHRKPGDIRQSYIINSTHVHVPTIWEALSRKGFRVGVIGVPPTFPPKPVNGFMISDFTTPSAEKNYTWPPWLKNELEGKFGPYIFDVVYRSEDKDGVAKDIFKMIKQHLNITKYLLQKKKWDLFIYIEVAVDRVHHAFWKYFDKDHPRYTYHPKYSHIIPGFYTLLDEWFAEIRKILPRDTIIIVASDHGVKPMKGAFVINQWLQEQGYLKLRKLPSEAGQDLDESIIDWNATTAWAWGGYYSRIFVNLKDREPKGIVKKEEYESIVNQLKNDLRKVKGPNGEQWDNKVYTPQELYREVNGDAPDMLLYIDDLNWRPAGTIGWNALYLPENDRGPDDAEHDWHGIFTLYDSECTAISGFRGEIKIEKIYQKLGEVLKS